MVGKGEKSSRKQDSALLAWNGKSSNKAGIPISSLQLDSVYLHGNAVDPASLPPEKRPPCKLIKGDNIAVMNHLLSTGWKEKIDLIYIDPPFWSGEDYYTNGEEALAYKDRWEGGIDSYLAMIFPRLQLMRDLLAETGSIFVHVDWHAGHYIKLLLDEIFGRGNLRNEIVWYYGGPSPVKTSFPRKHDVIYYYAKGKDFTFSPQYAPIKQYLRDRARTDPNGRLWVDQNVGKITARKFNELASEGRVFKTKTGRYRRKQFLDEMSGDMIDDVWAIPIINSQANERLGYPTQKPEALLQRVIACATKEGDIIADFFCGSGTSLIVAESMGRPWIGVDSSDVAISIARDRLTRGIEASFTLETT
nr:site-specific DNA-methyltransferase [Candidatus Sigynarchaeota archaeon]